MVKDATRDRALPEDFPARVGRIVRAEGPVVEAHFPLDGAHDDVPEESFHFAGGIDEVLARVRRGH